VLRTGMLIALAGAVGVLLVYLLFWPVAIDPIAWTPPEAPPLTGDYEPNDRLASVERLGKGVGLAPEDVARKITPKTKAIIPIHYGGSPCHCAELAQIAKKHDIFFHGVRSFNTYWQ